MASAGGSTILSWRLEDSDVGSRTRMAARGLGWRQEDSDGGGRTRMAARGFPAGDRGSSCLERDPTNVGSYQGDCSLSLSLSLSISLFLSLPLSLSRAHCCSPPPQLSFLRVRVRAAGRFSSRSRLEASQASPGLRLLYPAGPSSRGPLGWARLGR